jgi:hypothetical protein
LNVPPVTTVEAQQLALPFGPHVAARPLQLGPSVPAVTHCPALHTGVAPPHAVPFCHCPFASHVCGVLPLHCFAPGAHTPWHTPLTHAWFWHALPLCHCPDASHVWGICPLHCLLPGVHTPVHAPLAHAYGHAVPSCHDPFTHVCGTWPLHCFAPSVHDPVQVPAEHT